MTAAHIVVRRLTKLTVLAQPSIDLLTALRAGPAFEPGANIIGDQEPMAARFLLAGWAARVRHLADGRRQIIAFVMPGEGLGLCERPQPLSLCPVVALTQVQTIDASQVVQAALTTPTTRYADLALALHLSAALDESFLIDQAVRLGRQTALERMAHLFLELRYRQGLVNAAQADSFAAPLTQERIADAMGLSAVHVNRTLQQFRRDGLLDLAQGRVWLHRPKLLEAIADWRVPQLTRWGSFEEGRFS